MKKAMKTLSVLLVLALTLGLAAACGSGDTGAPPAGSDDTGNAAQDTPQDSPADAPAGDETVAADEPESGLPPMTTEPITLRYAAWGQHEKGEPEVREAQLAAFMAEYPNITVEFVEIDQAAWDESLQNFAATGMLPDVFGVFSVSAAVMNEWALPLDELYDADPDTAEMYPAFAQNAKINNVRYSMPWVMFPHIVVLNKTMFEMYNEPLPGYDWTVDEYFDLAERLTHPSDFYFGTSNPLYEDLFPAWYNGNQGKWGWDGTNYNFDQVWINAMNTRYDLIDSGVVEWAPPEDKETFLGDPDAWPPGWGRVAMHFDWPWTIAGFVDNFSVQSGCEFLFYPLPAGPSGQELAIVDNIIIAASTEHPREAWELMKYVSWGKDANLVRQQAYRDAGANVSRMPVTPNAEVWQDLIDNASNDNFRQLYLQWQQASFVPSNWPVSPGWGDFEAWINENDVYGRMERKEISPADIAPELHAKANELKDAWIANIP